MYKLKLEIFFTFIFYLSHKFANFFTDVSRIFKEGGGKVLYGEEVVKKNIKIS